MDTVELGYAISATQADEIRECVKRRDIHVSSVHNYCPVPQGAMRGHPEHFLIGSAIARERQQAIRLTLHTLSLAADVQAKAVVVHAARVKMKHYTPVLIDLADAGKINGKKWIRTFNKELKGREKRAAKHLEFLRRSLDELLPHFEAAKIPIALENLPSWDTMPNEIEMLSLCKAYDSPYLRYWHDIGHGQVRENLGFINHEHWVETLMPFLAGTHIHDCAPPANDHLVPPYGRINFQKFKPLADDNILKVWEPAPGTPAEILKEGIQALRESWAEPGVGPMATN